jgi:N-methylhydantoinase A
VTGARLAVDIGGTFTDLALEHRGTRVTAKVLTTPDAPEQGVLTGVAEILRRASVAPGDITLLIHGTTLATNAIIERRGARTGLITTEGFRDVLAMGNESRYDQYDLDIVLPEPLIPRNLRLPVPERLDRSGAVLLPLNEDAVRARVRELLDAGVASIAVGFLHAFVNPAHERRVRDIIAEMAPGIAVSLSSDVSPEMREWERFSTTASNAYVQPLIAGYLGRLETALRDAGLAAPILLMLSGGGLTTLATARRFPIRLVESGPAGGAIFAAHIARSCGLPRALSFDMGGTTAKICLIDGFTPQTGRSFEVARIGRFRKGSGLPLRIPVIEMVEIGAGGGSIARPQLGTIQVGPDSAGSQPGPVCYGRGGTEPTVTDANLVLGYLNPENFAGGSLRLDLEAARRAIAEKVARPLGLSPEEAAWGIHAMVNLNMELATRVVSIERGFDPRRLALVATGGSGPVHGCRLVQALGIDTAILPAASGVASAIGLLVAEIKFDVSRTFLGRLDALEPATVEALFAEMAEEAAAVIRDSTGQEPVRLEREVDLRYVGQGYELTVPFASLETVRATFEEVYARRYGMASPDEPVEATTWRLTAFGRRAPVELPAFEPGPAPRPTYRRAYFPEHEGWTDTAVYRRERLTAGTELCGPAIVEERESTTVLPPGFSATVDRLGNLIARRLEGRGR